MYFYNGSYYKGEWLNGKQHGFGRYIFENGDYYEGEFYDGKMNGKGTMVYYSKGSIYDGE
eukprot:CAMPEP_0168316640 /NCGR_PEP_ID=MMETSP0210-20121227/17671_1 /TAXON_ID=40633 /ORGANISM="Condylostoma magnum, Strain COL2" /LENGTH=59 /DNA_ID=CAMNT_0008301455 /DNA_START=197 /DNA_END=376 /DNA_ORIENTATION=+